MARTAEIFVCRKPQARPVVQKSVSDEAEQNVGEKSLPLEGRDALSKRAGGIPTRGKRATNLTSLFAAKAGHEAYSKMSGGHLVARMGRDL